MHQKFNQHTEALSVTEDTWRHLQPDSPGYRPWAAQLSKKYGAFGRPDDAVAVIEDVWKGVSAYSARFPNDAAWRYKSQEAKLMLSKVYRQHQRPDEANALEAKCKALEVERC
jgi:hypothetical protein